MAVIAARVSRTSTQQNIGVANSWVAITMDTEKFDPGGLYAAGSPTRLTAPRSGIYAIGANVSHAAVTGRLGIRKNGTTIVAQSYKWWHSSQEANCSGLIWLDAGDYIELVVNLVSTGHNIPGTLETTNDKWRCELWSLLLPSGIGARAYASAGQALSADTTAAISANGTRFDTGSIWSAGQPTRLVAPTTGRYLVGAHVKHNSSAPTDQHDYLMIEKSDGSIPTWAADRSWGNLSQSVLTLIDLTAGQYVEGKVFRHAGAAGALTVDTNEEFGADVYMALVAPTRSVHARRDAAFTSGAGAWTGVPLNEADLFDDGSLHDTASNNTRITFPSDAIVLAGLSFQSGNPGGEQEHYSAIRKNGAVREHLRNFNARGGLNGPGDAVLMSLSAGDYIEGMVFNGGQQVLDSDFWAMEAEDADTSTFVPKVLMM